MFMAMAIISKNITIQLTIQKIRNVYKCDLISLFLGLLVQKLMLSHVGAVHSRCLDLEIISHKPYYDQKLEYKVLRQAVHTYSQH